MTSRLYGHWHSLFTIASLLLVALLPASVAEDSPTIMTDRPSFTASTQTVGPGTLQLETGSTFAQQTRQLNTVTLPETQLRIGLTDRIEAQLFAPNWQYQTQGSNQQRGFSDITLALKYRLPSIPVKSLNDLQLTLYPTLTVPTGANQFSSNGVDPSVNLLLAKPLGTKGVAKRFTLASQLGVSLNPSTRQGNHATATTTAMLGFAASNNINLYAEYAAFTPLNNGSQSQHIINTGASYAFTHNQQIDVRTGMGLSNNAPHWFIGAGYALRVPSLFN